jgi:hypothetical protein
LTRCTGRFIAAASTSPANASKRSFTAAGASTSAATITAMMPPHVDNQTQEDFDTPTPTPTTNLTKHY